MKVIKRGTGDPMAVTVADLRLLLDGLPDDVPVFGWEQRGGSIAIDAGGRMIDLTFGRFTWCPRIYGGKQCRLAEGHIGRHEYVYSF